ncbi:MAG: cadherin-like domain-containing protein, partial [Verrucomicrobiales bacterium]|nr:cadherin-like domain-containing protein [Verrucomicrobiales bacterium]
MPLALARSYSSLVGFEGRSFGSGWTLGGLDLAFTTNASGGSTAESGVLSAYAQGTRAYLNLPDGRRVGFTFTPVETQAGNLTVARPAWTPDAGVTFRLASVDAVLEEVGGAYHQFGTGLPYNPESGLFEGYAFSLTAPDGVRYDYDASGNLRLQTSATGTRILWSDSGAVGGNNERITLRRDAEGRLTTVLLPDGAQLQYDYDEAGNLQAASSLSAGVRTWYGYDASGRLTLLLEPAVGTGLSVRYDAQGALVASEPIETVPGQPREFLGVVTPGSVAAGERDRWGLLLGRREIATSVSGRLTLGVDVRGVGGFQPAAARVEGALASVSRVADNRSVTLVTFDEGGPYVGSFGGVAGVDGSYTLELYLPGDVNGDRRVDGTDATQFAAAFGTIEGELAYRVGADGNRDGVVDATDELLLISNFGFVANQAPAVVTRTYTTVRNVPITVPVSELATDPEGDVLSFAISGARNGTATLSADGRSVLFRPAAGFEGAATFEVRADDGTFGSAPGTVTVNVSGAELVRLILGPKDPSLREGEVLALRVLAQFADGQTTELPAGRFSIVSSDSSTVLVSGAGTLLALKTGTAVVEVEADGVRAAIAVKVGDVASVGIVDVYPATYALTTGGETRQFVVRVQPAQGLARDVSRSVDGTRYVVSDPRLATITADGLLTTNGLTGVVDVTVIHGGQSFTSRLQIVTPTVGRTTVGTGGAIVRNADGFGVSIGAGTFRAGTTVELLARTQADLPYALPGGFAFAGAADLRLGGASPATGLAVTAPAPAGSRPGDVLILFRPGKVVRGPGQFENQWEVIDHLVVGTDGVARSASPPHPGVRVEGMLLLAAAPGGLMALTGAMAVASASLASGGGGSYVETDPQNGQAYFSLSDFFFQYYLPIVDPNVRIHAIRVSPEGR